MLYIKNKFYKILIVLMSIICVFFNTSVSYVRADTNAVSYYEASDIKDDLTEIYGVEKFEDLSKRTDLVKNRTTISVITFLEYGFDEQTNNALYSLFLYVYCPSNLKIENNSFLNYIQMGFTTDSKKVLSVEYEKLHISFLDELKIDNYSGTFSKWKIQVSESKSLSIFINNYYGGFEKRIYCLSGVEFLLSNHVTATEYVIGESYHISADEKGNVISTRSSIDTVQVETHHTFYRTGYSEVDPSINSGWQTQISSCYFAVPKFLEKKYGLLTSMTVSFENKYQTPMLIVQDEETKKAFEKFVYTNVHDSDKYPYFYTKKNSKTQRVITPGSLPTEGPLISFQNFEWYDVYFNSTNLNKVVDVLYNYKVDDGNRGHNNMEYLDYIFVDENLKYQDFEDMSTYYFDKQNIYDYLDKYYFSLKTGSVIEKDIEGVEKPLYRKFYDYFNNKYFTRSADSFYDDTKTEEEINADINKYMVQQGEKLLKRLRYSYMFEKGDDLYATGKVDSKDDNSLINENYPINKLGFKYNTKIEQTYAINENTMFADAITSLSFGKLDNQYSWRDWWKIIYSALSGKRPFIDQTISPIIKVAQSDFYLDNDKFAQKYLVDENEVPLLKKYAQEQQLSQNDVYLLRYDLCEYYCAPVTIELSEDKSTQGVIARQSAYLNFDVLQFEYRQDGISTIIPANHSPINVFNSITGQENVDLTIFYGFLGILLAFVILVLLCAFCPSIIGPLFKIIWYAVTAPFKVVFTLIKLIFKAIIRNKYNE